MVSIKKSRLKDEDEDKDELWKIIQEIISKGEINNFSPIHLKKYTYLLVLQYM